MARDGVDIQFEGLEEFISLLENYSPEVGEAVVQEMNKYAKHVEGGAKKLAPVDTHDLVDSITTSEVQRDGSTYFFTIGSDKEYALRMHEWQGNWGVRTMLKQAKEWRGYTPGNKYLENAVRGTEDDWNEAMENVLDKTIRKGRF